MFALCASLQCNPSPWSFPNTWAVLVHGLPQRNLSNVQKFFPSYRMYLTPYTEISKPNIVGEFIVKSQSCFYRTINLLFKKKKKFLHLYVPMGNPDGASSLKHGIGLFYSY